MQGPWNAPFSSFAVVTKSDTTLINCRAIYVGTSAPSDVAISTSATATAITFKNVPQGSIINMELNGGRIMSTGTTASNLVMLA